MKGAIQLHAQAMQHLRSSLLIVTGAFRTQAVE